MSSIEQVKRILKDLKDKKYAPIYFLCGEETYFIDQIVDYISKNVLNEDEQEFNLLKLYGDKNISIEDIIANARRYPMVAKYLVIIVKEAQQLRNIETLISYLENINKSTILVFAYRNKKPDRFKKLYKLIQAKGELLESKKLYQRDVQKWMQEEISKNKFEMPINVQHLLLDSLGTDLKKIKHELDKLKTAIYPQKKVSLQEIETYIGISKDFNNFELRKAIGMKDFSKAYRIIYYFKNNPRDNPFIMTVSTIYIFFVQLLKYHGLKNKSPKNVAEILRVHSFFVKDYQQASINYSMKQCSKAIQHLRKVDLMSKGVGAYQISLENSLKEMLIFLN